MLLICQARKNTDTDVIKESPGRNCILKMLVIPLMNNMQIPDDTIPFSPSDILKS